MNKEKLYGERKEMKNKTPPAPNYYIDLEDKTVHVNKDYWELLDRDGDSRLFLVGPNDSTWLYEDERGDFYEVIPTRILEEEMIEE